MASILNITFIIILQITAYVIFLRPKLLAWGAAKDEMTMPLIGDNLAPRISSTRAISINAPVSEVWKWIIQLGADRGGFFSYSFIEKALGYEMRDAELVPEFQEMEVGRIVPGSIDASKSLIKYDFQVVAVEPGKSFVLQGWGTFILKEISSTQTRLIVRTHGQESPTLLSKVIDFIGTPLHYIMERRMLMGFKSQAESGRQLSSTADNLWLLGIVLSGIGIALTAFVGNGIRGILLSGVYSIMWLWTLLIFAPLPKYSLGLLFIEVMTIGMQAAVVM